MLHEVSRKAMSGGGRGGRRDKVRRLMKKRFGKRYVQVEMCNHCQDLGPLSLFRASLKAYPNDLMATFRSAHLSPYYSHCGSTESFVIPVTSRGILADPQHVKNDEVSDLLTWVLRATSASKDAACGEHL